MSIFRQIKKADDLALVNIILDYARGHSIDEITLRLKEQCTKFNLACKVRYEAMKQTDGDSEFNDGVNKILDELSVGGSQLHVMSVQLAKDEKKFNCYVWDGTTLTWLQSGKPDEEIILNDAEPLVRMINVLKLKSKSNSIHLFAKQIDDLITLNSVSRHVPHTTDSNFILQCKACPNLYDLLKKLETRYPRLSVLIDKINTTKPARNWWLYLMFASGSVAIAGFVYYLKENFDLVKAWYERTLPVVSRWFHNTVYLLSKTPLIGITTHALPLIGAWYQAIINGSFSDANKAVKLTFKTLEHTLPLIGYLLCYLAAGAMTVPAVALFITGAAIDIVESLYSLTYHQVKRYFNPLAPATEYHSATALACADNIRERNLYISLTKIASNLLTTASVIVWCIFPPSLLIALTCITLSTVVGLIKNVLITQIKNNYAHALQSSIKDISDQYAVPYNAEADVENLVLTQQNQVLQQKNLQLTSELNAVREIRETDRTEWMRLFNNRPPDASTALTPNTLTTAAGSNNTP